MRRHTITLPLLDNEGQSLADVHSSLTDYLLARAGGATVTDSTGLWRGDDGTVYREEVRTYAADSADPHLWDDLRALASSVATAARQDAVYVTRQPIETHLALPLEVAA